MLVIKENGVRKILKRYGLRLGKYFLEELDSKVAIEIRKAAERCDNEGSTTIKEHHLKGWLGYKEEII